MFGVCVILKQFIHLNSAMSMIMQMIVGAIVYFGILLVLKDEFLFMFLNRGTQIVKSKIKK